jgi:hypothetical protein
VLRSVERVGIERSAPPTSTPCSSTRRRGSVSTLNAEGIAARAVYNTFEEIDVFPEAVCRIAEGGANVAE